MRRRPVLFLTPLLLLAGVGSANLGPAGVPSAWAQSSPAAVVQRLHDETYARCMADGRFGAGGELQENCSCSADVVLDQLSQDFLHAIADGTEASYKGPKLQGDAKSFNAALLAACPKIAPFL